VKTFLKILFSFLFILTVPVLALSLSVRLSQFSGNYLKQTLDDSNVYSKLYQQLLKLVDSSDKDNPASLIFPFIKKDLSAPYFQAKIDAAIDDTEKWVVGTSSAPPQLSFVDLKDKLMSQNGKIVTQLESMEKVYIQKKSELGTEAQVEGLPDINLSQYLKKEPIIPLSNYFGWLKVVYFASHMGLYMLGGLLILYLLLMILLKPEPKAILTTLSVAFYLHRYGIFCCIYQLAALCRLLWSVYLVKQHSHIFQGLFLQLFIVHLPKASTRLVRSYPLSYYVLVC
jgi:hypothetical protein